MNSDGIPPISYHGISHGRWESPMGNSSTVNSYGIPMICDLPRGVSHGIYSVGKSKSHCPMEIQTPHECASLGTGTVAASGGDGAANGRRHHMCSSDSITLNAGP